MQTQMTREEWLNWRKGGIGGSDAAAVLGVSKWATPFELLLQKAGYIDGRVRQPWEWKAMNRGIRLEPFARAAYEDHTGIEAPKDYVVHRRYPQLRVSVDGVNWNLGRPSEFKCPGKKDHALAKKGIIPPHYEPQLRHTMMVLEMDWIDYWSYREDDEKILLSLQRDLKKEARLMECELGFWKLVERHKRDRAQRKIYSNVIPFRR